MKNDTKKICWIRVVKNICYFIVPILLASLFLSIISVVYVYKMGIVKEEENYYETTRFAEAYFDYVKNNLSIMNNIEQEKKENVEEKYRNSYEYYYRQIIDYNGNQMEAFAKYYSYNFIYVIIDNNNNNIYGNIEYDISHSTVESLKNEVLSNSLYWVYEDGNVNTTIEKLKSEKIKTTNWYKENLEQGDYTIYTAIRDGLPYYDDFLTDSMLYSVVKNQYDYAVYNVPLTIILLVVMVPIVLIGIGKTREEKGIHLTWFDKISIEFATFILGTIAFILCGLAFSIGTTVTAIVSIVFILLGLIILYICGIFLLETIVKRLKTHTFIKTTFAYWVYQKVKLVFNNMKLSLRIGICFAIFIIANWIIFDMLEREAFIAFVLLICLYAFCFIYVLKRIIWYEKINNAIEQIYKGNTDVRLDEQEFKGDFKKVAMQINDIAGGLSNAVEEKLKSERLKTELITNVSHDIKTPLTSIINYVDLLKKEGLTEEKVAEYLAILDNKSQRLKKLTEDLVEASKASSGNIKMNMEKLEVNELIKQVSAEFEDKFKARGLEEIITYTKEPVNIKADSRYMYRVLENMYSNVSKYAMENSRVYTDIIEQESSVIIQIKNISKDKLNITADELMQRFVRGDTSRNTEGSGLGLSIANSLTELQNGKFEIYLDGDLFKVTIEFEKMKY